MTHPVQPYLSTHPWALIRKKRLLELVPFSKTTLHSKLTEGGLYEDKSFPRPIYLPHSRTPFWREAEVQAWIEACTLSSRSDHSGKTVQPSARHTQSDTTTADCSRVSALESGDCPAGAATGALPADTPKRLVTTIGGRSVVITVRKERFLKNRSNAVGEGA